MKKARTKARATSPEMRQEYDFSKGVRGKYARRYRTGTNLVVLEPDVAAAYRDPQVVNDVLRAVAQVAAQRRPGRGAR